MLRSIVARGADRYEFAASAPGQILADLTGGFPGEPLRTLRAFNDKSAPWGRLGED